VAIAESSPWKGHLTRQLAAELRLYTNDDMPNVAARARDPHAVTKQPTWFLTYFDSPPTGTMHTQNTCDLIIAVNADNGTTIDVDQICPGTPRRTTHPYPDTAPD
jgi:hypothetical protein